MRPSAPVLSRPHLRWPCASQVTGRLSIGDPDVPLPTPVIFDLLPGQLNTTEAGEMAFAAVRGGQLDLHGFPGASTDRAWTRLAQTARKGDSNIGRGATAMVGVGAHRGACQRDDEDGAKLHVHCPARSIGTHSVSGQCTVVLHRVRRVAGRLMEVAGHSDA